VLPFADVLSAVLPAEILTADADVVKSTLHQLLCDLPVVLPRYGSDKNKKHGAPVLTRDCTQYCQFAAPGGADRRCTMMTFIGHVLEEGALPTPAGVMLARRAAAAVPAPETKWHTPATVRATGSVVVVRRSAVGTGGNPLYVLARFTLNLTGDCGWAVSLTLLPER
jgi:hypothetical protein